MNIKGFTLAEVLITLAIIGVVAALSIPSLLSQTNDKELAVALKKAYATLSQATMTLQAQQGSVNVGIASDIAASNTMRNQYGTVLSFVKTGTAQEIFGPTNYKRYKGGTFNWPGTDGQAAAALADGTLLYFGSLDACTYSGINSCGYFYIDINGPKGPNMSGKDLHFFSVAKKNNAYIILPRGVVNDSQAPLPSGCTAGSSDGTTSMGCTALMLTNPGSMP